MIFKIVTRKASEYAEWMVDNGLDRLIWRREDCPVEEISNFNDLESEYICLSSRSNVWQFHQNGSNISLKVLGNNFELHTI